MFKLINKSFIAVLSLLMVCESCTRNPYDPKASAEFNLSTYSFWQITSVTAIHALSVAGSSSGVLGVAVMGDDGEISIFTDEDGLWQELGRTSSATSDNSPILDIIHDTGRYWYVLVSDDEYGVRLYCTDGATDNTSEIPPYDETPWEGEFGRLGSDSGGNLSAVLAGQQPVLCIKTGESWSHHVLPDTTGTQREVLSYLSDPLGRHHILYRDDRTLISKYQCFTSGEWLRYLNIVWSGDSRGARGGEPLELSISESNNVRALGFHLSRNVLLLWEEYSIQKWEPEALPVAEDVLMDQYLSVTTTSDGIPHLVVAQYNGSSRYDLLWLSRDSSSWHVQPVVRGLYRIGQCNPVGLVDMVSVGTEPRLIFAELSPDGGQIKIWEATPRQVALLP